MTSFENHKIAPYVLPAIAYNPLLELSADGLRASTSDSKFFHCFIILEEFLEKARVLNQDFASLFDAPGCGCDRRSDKPLRRAQEG